MRRVSHDGDWRRRRHPRRAPPLPSLFFTITMFRRIRERLRRRAEASQDSSIDPVRAAFSATLARRRLRYLEHSMTLRSHDRVPEFSLAPAPTETAEAPATSEGSELSDLPSPSDPSEAADLGGLAEPATTTEAAETTDTLSSVEMNPSTPASGHLPSSVGKCITPMIEITSSPLTAHD